MASHGPDMSANGVEHCGPSADGAVCSVKCVGTPADVEVCGTSVNDGAVYGLIYNKRHMKHEKFNSQHRQAKVDGAYL